MKNSLKIQLIFCLLSTFVFDLNAAIVSNQKPTTEKELVVYKQGEGKLSKKELKKRTFKINQEIAYEIKGDLQTYHGKIVELSNEEILIHDDDGRKVRINKSRISRIRKRTKGDTSAKIAQIIISIGSGITLLGSMMSSGVTGLFSQDSGDDLENFFRFIMAASIAAAFIMSTLFLVLIAGAIFLIRRMFNPNYKRSQGWKLKIK